MTPRLLTPAARDSYRDALARALASAPPLTQAQEQRVRALLSTTPQKRSA